MDRTNDPDRRTVLKRLGAAAATGAAVGVGATGSATAREMSPAMQEIEPRSVAATVHAMPSEEDAVDRIIDAHAGGLLELLADDGLVETASVDALTTETVDPYTDSDVAGVSAYEFGDGETRRLVTVDTHVEGGVIEMSVEPGRNTVLAEFRGDDGTRVVYGDFGEGPQRAEIEADYCCACCICNPLESCGGIKGTEFCYGPERFGCPFAPGNCCTGGP